MGVRRVGAEAGVRVRGDTGIADMGRILLINLTGRLLGRGLGRVLFKGEGGVALGLFGREFPGACDMDKGIDGGLHSRRLAI